MSHTKKLTALLLALLLALGLAAPAAAADPASPAVTHITAEWNGEIEISAYGGGLIIDDNVTITVHYADSTTSTSAGYFFSIHDASITAWSASEIVFTRHDSKSGEVIFYYCNDALRQAFADANGITARQVSSNAPGFLESLPTASVTFPRNCVEQFFNSRMPLEQLTPGETKLVSVVAAHETCVTFAFTPRRNGRHVFEAAYISGHEPGSYSAFDGNFSLIAQGGSSDGMAMNLKKGKTYYIVMDFYTWGNDPALSEANVTVKYSPLTLWQKIENFFINLQFIFLNLLVSALWWFY